MLVGCALEGWEAVNAVPKEANEEPRQFLSSKSLRPKPIYIDHGRLADQAKDYVASLAMYQKVDALIWLSYVLLLDFVWKERLFLG